MYNFTASESEVYVTYLPTPAFDFIKVKHSAITGNLSIHLSRNRVHDIPRQESVADQVTALIHVANVLSLLPEYKGLRTLVTELTADSNSRQRIERNITDHRAYHSASDHLTEGRVAIAASRYASVTGVLMSTKVTLSTGYETEYHLVYSRRFKGFTLFANGESVYSMCVTAFTDVPYSALFKLNSEDEARNVLHFLTDALEEIAGELDSGYDPNSESDDVELNVNRGDQINEFLTTVTLESFRNGITKLFHADT